MSNYEIQKLKTEEEYWQIRDFLRYIWRLSNDKTMNWNVARLDYNRWHVYANAYELNLLDYLHICRLKGDITAVFIADSIGGYMLQVHPQYYQSKLFEQMLRYFDDIIAPSEQISCAHIPCEPGDKVLESALQKAGFRPSEWLEYRREADLSLPLTEAIIPEGFVIRSLGETDELPERSWASWRAFHPAEPDEKYEGWEWYHNIQRCPLYRRDLDLVCLSPDGRIASFCTIWYDDFNQTGYIDPVGTNPDFQRMGLGKALLRTGFERLVKSGALKAYIESYEEPAHKLYEAMGLKTVKIMKTWLKNYPVEGGV